MKTLIMKSSVLIGALTAFAAADTIAETTVTTAKASASVETSSVKKTTISKAAASAEVASASATGHSIKSSSTEVVEISAVGYGNSHVAAMTDACIQAVSQVCGDAVAQELVLTGGASLEGVLLSYTVVEDIKSEDGSYTIKIQAKVKPPVGDIFSDKIALVLPESSSIRASLMTGKLSFATVDALSAVVEECIKTSVSDDARFVVLDRNSALATQERHFADSSKASRLEKGKADGMKAADFVLEVKLVRGDEKMSVKEFKTAQRSKYTLAVNIELELRLVDVVTGGVLAREVVSIKSSGTSWREEKCLDSVSENVREKCSAAMHQKLDALFSKVQ